MISISYKLFVIKHKYIHINILTYKHSNIQTFKTHKDQ